MRRPLLRRATCVFTFILLWPQAHSENTENKVQSQKVALVKELYNKGFFKTGTCKEVASSFLKRAGLPGINEGAPVSGKRGNFVRAKQNEDLPILSDEVLNGGISTKFATHPRRDGWEIEISRTGFSGQRLETKIGFQLKKYKGGPSCEMTNAKFQMIPARGKAESKPIEVSTDDCLDLMISELAPLKKPIPDFAKIASIMKEDCAMGLHYSSSAKRLLETPN